MLNVIKRVGTITVRASISSDAHGTTVSGEAYPFSRHFHCVGFSAKREYEFQSGDMVPAKPTIGFGGNMFEGEKAARMIKAAEVAFEMASYYADLINAFEAGEYARSVRCAVGIRDSEALMDYLLLTPMENEVKDQDNLEAAMKLLMADGSALGCKGPITPENFEKLDQNARYGLMKLCTRHKAYELSGDDVYENRKDATARVIQYIEELNAAERS